MFTQRHLLIGLLAGALLTVQAFATAHEFDHALHQHDDSLCALHVYGANSGNAPVAICDFVVDRLRHTPEAVAPLTFVTFERAYDYHARAPPVLHARTAV